MSTTNGIPAPQVLGVKVLTDLTDGWVNYWECPLCPARLGSDDLADAVEYALEHADAYHRQVAERTNPMRQPGERTMRTPSGQTVVQAGLF